MYWGLRAFGEGPTDCNVDDKGEVFFRRIASVFVPPAISLIRSGLDKQIGELAEAYGAQNKKRKRNPVDRMSGKLRSREIALLRGKTRGRRWKVKEGNRKRGNEMTRAHFDFL